ncbi:unnamed protein product [Schistosoma margrebowiei]|uniref:Uncharacterized protein n=1 Tax=Schistosoma margrebowiei TaxID=48269 RepID=A0A183ME38_9TREM|nr:unnamed protein product [Schistosoma margrebowiei]
MEDVKSFIYLDNNIIDKQLGSDVDAKMRIGKASTAFLTLKNIWNSKQLSSNIKVTTFNTNIKIIPMNRAEMWRTTTTITKIEQVFINSCLRKIFKIRWLNSIRNNLL